MAARDEPIGDVCPIPSIVWVGFDSRRASGNHRPYPMMLLLTLAPQCNSRDRAKAPKGGPQARD